MKQACTIIFLLLVFTNLDGQETDTTKHKIPSSWKKFHIAPRVAIGTQRSFYTEIGFSLQKYMYAVRHGFIVYNAYSSFEWNPSHNGERSVYGPKIGYEIINNGGGGAIEIKYLTNGHVGDIVITPKLGFGIGLVDLFYGYNFSTEKYPFPKIRKHQFSLVINTNLLFYANKYEKK